MSDARTALNRGFISSNTGPTIFLDLTVKDSPGTFLTIPTALRLLRQHREHSRFGTEKDEETAARSAKCHLD